MEQREEKSRVIVTLFEIPCVCVCEMSSQGVELEHQFSSSELVHIAGQTQVKQVPLVPTLPCHLDDTPTAHCDGSERERLVVCFGLRPE